MKRAQHSAFSIQSTPGPWKYQEGADVYTHIIRGPNAEIVAQLSQDSSGRSEANARLIAALRTALDESVKLQSHYALLLNMHDGGKRLQFTSPEKWIERLIVVGDIAWPPPKR
jgi:hypothetical protein